MAEQERLPHDHVARADALDPTRSFLVQAPAGSGKTELLTDRILALLATVNRPEEIVAITFTRKAASEMHARVLSKLRRGLDAPPEAMHERRSWDLARAALARNEAQGWHLLDHPARLAIRTIDSFCAGLVRSMPWLSELGGMPEITDDARAHYEAAARATLDLADDYEAVRILLKHLDVDVQAAKEAIASMLGQRDQWLPLLRHGSDRAGMEAMLAEAIGEDLDALCEAMPYGWAEALCGPARLAATSLQDGEGENKLLALLDWTEELPPDADALDQWQAVAHLLLTGTGTLRKTVNKNLGFPPKCAHKEPFVAWLESADPDAAWVRRLHAVRDVPMPHFTDAQWEVLGAQLMTLALAVAQLRLRFADTGEVDFIEIAQRAAAALGSADDPGELLLKLDASIRHLLIDEFQDTSQTQLDLLRTLTSGWQQGDGRSLFLVGDPMQSIYRFRKAEVGLFLEVADIGVGELQPDFLNLTDNFRSQAGIVEWVNQSFAQLLPRRSDAAAGAIAYSPSTAFHEALPEPAVRFHPAWSREGAAPAETQAEDIAVELVRQALIDHKGAKHPVAVLVRARSHLGNLTRRLAQEGIRCRAVDLVPLALRPVVADLVQLVRALSHPGDRLAWLSVLRAPYCGLTLTSLQRLFGDDHITPVPVLLERALRIPPQTSSQAAPPTVTSAPQGSLFDAAPESPEAPSAQSVLGADEFERLRQVAEILLDKRNASGAMPFAAWVESLWRRLGGPALYAGLSVANDAESLFQLVERLAPHGAIDVAALDAGIARLFAAPDAADEDAGAVEIMTMHKSKGLQFETVILYGLHRAPRGDQAPLVRFEQSGGRVLFGPVKPRAETEADPLSRYLGAREARRASYEIDRLLYVAATRARKRLHLVGHVSVDEASGQAKTPSSSSLLGRLWPCLTVPVPPPLDGVAIAQAEDGPEWQGEPLRRVDRDGLAQLARLADVAVSPGFGAAARGVWGEGGEHPAWQLEAGYDAAIGTLSHAWLARIGQDGVQAWSADALAQRLPAMRRQLTRAGIPASQADAASEAVLETLQATLADERGLWLLSQSGARREWPLIDAAGKVSVIDLALSTEDGWLIVDYKTGRPHPGESPAAFAARMRQRHGDQLLRYCAQVTALDGRAARAALYFPRARAWIDL
ncbi:ATP-dependent helicase/nuclease subunit A [Achromobacter insolitus]|uniref:UvrD-helicase domain-containing protein n=1 Tax=Achromobacter insolitus TaxID=217204 RepID=UPI000972B9D5|nr:UvrD-helicase domain-containing protein [Achromobacter insolitus]APX75854.1 nuclease [Achromobacter insolitus]OWT56495.1 nuclease [Achromobacter insolitus]CAB3741467.1 ATP-dependent helicase/nuclease subunit A [Achromobacter insolitus]VEG66895.1 ATP-dependent helicase/nuclease subunit A [Achromobacter insolitus]